VWLNNRQGNLLARYAGTKFDTAAHAQAGMAGGFGDVFGVTGVRTSMTLHTGLPATTVVDTANNESHVLWSEGRWKMDVSGLKTTAPAIDTANEVVAYLHTHMLPVPGNVGEIAVTNDAGKLSVMMIWQEGDNMFQVQSAQSAKQPIETALAMAISMKKYQ